MKRMTNLFLAALVGFSALSFGSCKSEIDKAGKSVDETMEKAKEQTGQIMEKTGAAIKEAGEKMQESGKAEKKQWHSPLRLWLMDGWQAQWSEDVAWNMSVSAVCVVETRHCHQASNLCDTLPDSVRLRLSNLGGKGKARR